MEQYLVLQMERLCDGSVKLTQLKRLVQILRGENTSIYWVRIEQTVPFEEQTGYCDSERTVTAYKELLYRVSYFYQKKKQRLILMEGEIRRGFVLHCHVDTLYLCTLILDLIPYKQNFKWSYSVNSGELLQALIVSNEFYPKVPYLASLR